MRKELVLASSIALLVLLIVNLPILYFFLVGKPGLVFLGRRVINSQDLYTYVSYITQAQEGKTLFRNLYTTEPQSGTILRPTYLLIGKVSGMLGISSIAAYHLARVVFSLLFCVALYRLLLEVFRKSEERLLAFTLLLTSSGLGWALSRFVASSDTWIPESNTFLSLAESPHFILSQALLILGVLLFLRFIERRDRRLIIALICCFTPIAFDHPFDLLVLGPTLVLTAYQAKIPLLESMVAVGMSMAGILWPWYEWKTNPVFSTEQAQGA